jgi:hypothetical protein
MLQYEKGYDRCSEEFGSFEGEGMLGPSYPSTRLEHDYL